MVDQNMTEDADIAAAHEAVRRGMKGLPADRLYDGTDGANRLWRGILKLGVIISDQEAQIEEYKRIEHHRGNDAMRLHSADTKYKADG